MRVRKAEVVRDLGWVNFKAPRLVGTGVGVEGGRERVS